MNKSFELFFHTNI